jgi:hypothetical protein
MFTVSTTEITEVRGYTHVGPVKKCQHEDQPQNRNDMKVQLAKEAFLGIFV